MAKHFNSRFIFIQLIEYVRSISKYTHHILLLTHPVLNVCTEMRSIELSKKSVTISSGCTSFLQREEVHVSVQYQLPSFQQQVHHFLTQRVYLCCTRNEQKEQPLHCRHHSIYFQNNSILLHKIWSERFRGSFRTHILVFLGGFNETKIIVHLATV